jgi:thiamine pyrophosphate-dependent acetolactate synthase large subunit-like protein
METWAQIKDLDWSLVSVSGVGMNWPNRLWPMEKHYHWLGASGGYGVGYGAPAAVGAALANRDLGRFSVNIQSDGDLMYAPGVLWTAARHNIPLLAVMFNNRGYHQEVMHVQRLSNFRNRVASLGKDMGPIGTSIENPDIEYHKLAESMGWWAKGPWDPAGPAIKQAVAAVKSGQPALVASDATALRGLNALRCSAWRCRRRWLPIAVGMLPGGEGQGAYVQHG